VLRQIRAQGIALEITQNGEQVLVYLDREGFEAPLPDMAVTAGMIMPMMTTDMRGHEPHRLIAQIIVVPRPNHQMKMVGHQAIRQRPNRRSFLRLFQRLDESGEFGVFAESGFSSVAPIKHVIAIPGSGSSCGAWHAGDFLGWKPGKQAKCTMAPYFFHRNPILFRIAMLQKSPDFGQQVGVNIV
jgi:hypothetical protein